MASKIPTTPAFYKHTTNPSDYWAVGLHKVTNANYELLIEDHEQHTYPVDGWEYHVTPPAEFVTWYNKNFIPEPEE